MLTIGDFSRATHLSVKMLRHYHDIGLLEPADVDRYTGYRRYGTAQIATAQVIRRFRDLDMPLEEIHAVLSAPDPQTRSRLISAHLARLEASLARTQDAVAALRGLLERPPAAAPVRHRHAAAVSAAAITEVVDVARVLAWYQGVLGELHATWLPSASPPLALWRHLPDRDLHRRARRGDDLSPVPGAPAAHGPGHRNRRPRC